VAKKSLVKRASKAASLMKSKASVKKSRTSERQNNRSWPM
jgi:hypothetical protein